MGQDCVREWLSQYHAIPNWSQFSEFEVLRDLTWLCHLPHHAGPLHQHVGVDWVRHVLLCTEVRVVEVAVVLAEKLVDGVSLLLQQRNVTLNFVVEILCSLNVCWLTSDSCQGSYESQARYPASHVLDVSLQFCVRPVEGESQKTTSTTWAQVEVEQVGGKGRRGGGGETLVE